ncbi:MAG TPA: SusC/RagA family TonB-linked outer membrane protein [Gemmatimonadaceae bacterium]|nr:SusC/RagA family TonB-linked outer membrane protein [Gemmatimonadaceae bacterium]
MNSRFRRFFSAAVALAVLPAMAAAQDGATVSGRVTSDAGAPLASAAVTLQGMNIGTLTREDGRYSISVPAARVTGQQVTVQAQLLGYRAQTRQVTLTAGAHTVDFALPTNPLRLGEVVVTGAGTEQEAQKLGFTRATVDSGLIKRTNEANVVQALAGKVPNVQVDQMGGEPGASTAIRIRGPKTISQTGQPLFVVDGMPINNNTRSTNGFSQGGSSLSGTVTPNRASDINPDDIENIEILKGAAASAIYGAAAGSGVVLITTKKGRPGRTSYSLRSTAQFDKPQHVVPVQQSFGVGSRNVSFNCTTPNCSVGPTFFSWGPALAPGTETFNHAEEIFETGQMFDNTLSVSGGTDRTQFYLSGGAVVHNGFITGDADQYKRYSVRFNGAHRVLDNLKVAANVSYVNQEGDFLQRGNSINGTLLGSLRQPPDFDAKNFLTEEGLHRSWRFPNPVGTVGLLANRGFDNPFYVIEEGEASQTVGRVFGNVNVDWQALNWLRVNWTLGADYSGDDRVEARAFQSSGAPAQGSVIKWQLADRILDHNLVVTANYRATDFLSGTLSLGQNLNEQWFRQVTVTGNSLISPRPYKLANTVSRSPANDDEARSRTEGYFAQLTADLWDQVYFTTAIRNDGSSTFSTEENRAWYPKASVAWEFTKLADGPIGFLDYGKVRAAYGQTGQQPAVYLQDDIFVNTPFLDFNPGSTIIPALGGFGGYYTSRNKGNPDIRPERITEWEGGIDLGLFGERSDLGVTYYHSMAKDVIFNVPLPPSTGFTTQSRNAAKIRNEGVEATLNVRPYTSKDFSIALGANFAKNQNKVLTLGDPNIQVAAFGLSFIGSTTHAVVGEPLGVFRGQDFARCGRGLTTLGTNDIEAACQGQPDGALFIAASGFPVVDPNTYNIGDPNPDWTGGLNAEVTVRRVRFSGFLDIRQGGKTLNMTKASMYQYGTHRDTEARATCTTVNNAISCTGNELIFGRDLLKGPVVGPGAGMAVPIGENWWGGNGNVGGPRAQFMEDASNVRLREVAVAYTFDMPWVQRQLGFTSIDVKVAGRNLKMWTDYTGFDPEPNLAGAGIANRGVDWFVNPLAKAWVFSVALNR